MSKEETIRNASSGLLATFVLAVPATILKLLVYPSGGWIISITLSVVGVLLVAGLLWHCAESCFDHDRMPAYSWWVYALALSFPVPAVYVWLGFYLGGAVRWMWEQSRG